jgi:hypothetical protein
MGWFTDFLRFWWGLLYWNLRKTLFRSAPGRFRCPCQCPSDSGKAYETQCEAAQTWSKPRLFRHVCPLLKTSPEGLRCSADTNQVRPFWGRALSSYLTAIVGTYMLAGLLVFSAMRLVGYPVGFTTIVWPGSWGQFSKAKARYFFNKGSEALSEGHFREGTIALNLSYQLDPSLYPAGITLARFATLLQPDQCDALFGGLMKRHPEHARTTAEQWMRSALSRGKFEVMRSLALERLRISDETTPPYLHALLFSTRVLGDNATLRDFLNDPRGQPWRQLFTTELLLREGRNDEAAALLSQSWYPKRAYCAYYQTHQLLAIGKLDDAMIMAGVYQDLMSGNDLASLYLGIMAVRGDKVRMLEQSEELLRNKETRSAAIETLGTHLVRYPDADLLRLVVEKLRRAPLPMGEASDRAYLALFCAAGVQKDEESLSILLALIKARSGSVLVSLNAAHDFFMDEKSTIKMDNFLPVFPVSLDLLYALHEHYLLKGNVRTVPGTK